MFDLVREPIRQACGIHIGHTPGARRPHALRPDFDLQKFHKLAQGERSLAPELLWAATFHNMPVGAADYLLEHLPPAALLLCCDMPPWLRRMCQNHSLYFLDLRYSPLRFGRDLYIALDTNHPVLRKHLQQLTIPSDEMHLEAALLGANMRGHRSRLKEKHHHLFDLDGALIYIPQLAKDKSLLSENGQFLLVNDFSEQLQKLAAGRNLFVMTDYLDQPMHSISKRDCESLTAILNTTVQPCPQNAYQVLSTHEDVELIGINAPLLQEASWFNKISHSLIQPLTPLADPSAPESEGYLQVHFHDILAPFFWHQLLMPEAPAPRIAKLPFNDRNYGREMLDEWGEYEKVLNWERPFQQRAFDRSGGIVHRRRLDSLEKQHMQTAFTSTITTPADAMQARIRALKDTRTGQTAYILGNAPSLMELDIDELMQRESFWFNKAFTLQDQGFCFRPKYYFLRDISGAQQWMTDILAFQADIKFFGREAYDFIKKINPKAFSEQNALALEVHQTPGNCMFDDENNFSYDPSQIVYSGYTSVLDAVQIAFYMGYTRVLIGGVDLDYTLPYFYGDMAPSRNGLQDWITERMRQSFTVARKNYEKNGRILAKITTSPHLPLDYIDAPEIRHKQTPSA